MAGSDFVFNIAKGRAGEFYYRVKNNDPANSAFVAVVLASSGLETDAVLIDKDTLSDVVAGSTNEVTNTNYTRKTITDTDLASIPAPDDANDRYDYPGIPSLTWSPGPAAGDGWAKLLICYDNDTTSGTDANIVPVCAYNINITPDGSVITINFNSAGFFRAA